MNFWLRELLDRLRLGAACVRVLVAKTTGSAPCTAGQCLLVSPQGVWGTIGGGRLEYLAIARARGLLEEAIWQPCVRQILLGKGIQQCCGGQVTLWWEPYAPSDAPQIAEYLHLLQQQGCIILESSTLPMQKRSIRNPLPPFAPKAPRLETDGEALRLVEVLFPETESLWLFGAGHVGQAIVNTLADLPFQIFWVDNRPEYLAGKASTQVVPQISEQPADRVHEATPGSWFLVMTQDHALDFSIVRAVLQRADARYLGLIGSRPKAKHFRHQLSRHGFSAEQIDTLICPIGLPDLHSKHPKAIAISTVAEILRRWQP